MWRFISIAVLVVMVISFLCGCRDKEVKGEALPQYTVEVAAPQRGTVEQYREWVGTLEAQVTAPILPQVSGYITERLFTNGQLVKAGQVLYRIGPEHYEQALEQAGEQQQEAQAQYDEARQNTAYYRPLVGNGSISRQTFTDAVHREQAAAAALAAAKAAVALARTNVGYCTLVSPVEGIAGFARADIGSYVAPDSSPLVEVSQVNPIRVYFSISEQDWLNQGGAQGALSPGAEVELLLSNGEAYPHKATIEGVDNAVVPATGTLRLDAHVPNPEALLRPGMYVKVRARVAEQKDAMLVPVGAVVSIQGKTMLVEVDGKGAASLVPVTTGLQQGGMVAVQGALSPDSRIIVSGTQQGMMAAEGRARLHAKSQP